MAPAQAPAHFIFTSVLDPLPQDRADRMAWLIVASTMFDLGFTKATAVIS